MKGKKANLGSTRALRIKIKQLTEKLTVSEACVDQILRGNLWDAQEKARVYANRYYEVRGFGVSR